MDCPKFEHNNSTTRADQSIAPGPIRSFESSFLAGLVSFSFLDPDCEYWPDAIRAARSSTASVLSCSFEARAATHLGRRRAGCKGDARTGTLGCTECVDGFIVIVSTQTCKAGLSRYRLPGMSQMHYNDTSLQIYVLI